VLSQPALDSFEYETRTSPQLVKILNEISPKVNGKSNLNIDFVITLQKPKPALEYPSPLPLPTVGAIPSCPGVSVPPLASGAVANSARDAKATAGSGPSSSPSPIAVRNTSGRNTSGRNPAGAMDWLIWIPPLIALAILIKVMSRAVPLLRPRLTAALKRKNRGE
jgi:phospholipid/cholesterol/gamma-HCH transport system substrate-binding protein